MQFRQKARRSFAAIAAFVLLIFTMAIPIGAAEAEDKAAVSDIEQSFFYNGGHVPNDLIEQILGEAIVCITLNVDDLIPSNITTTASAIVTRFNAVVLKFEGCNPGWMENECGQFYHIGKELTITTVPGSGYYVDYIGSGRTGECAARHITRADDSSGDGTKDFILDGSVRFETLKIYGFSCSYVSSAYDRVVNHISGRFSFPKAARLAYDQGILRAKLDIAEQIVISAYGDDNGVVDEVELEQYFGIDWILSRSVKQLTKHAIGAGHDVGYYAGYDDGGRDGYSQGFDEGYDEGYDEGLDDGYDKGYGDGADFGRTDALNTTSTFKDGIFAIFNAPVDLINGILDFDLLGINVAGLVKTVLTLCIVGLIVFFVFKLQKGG